MLGVCLSDKQLSIRQLYHNVNLSSWINVLKRWWQPIGYSFQNLERLDVQQTDNHCDYLTQTWLWFSYANNHPYAYMILMCASDIRDEAYTWSEVSRSRIWAGQFKNRLPGYIYYMFGTIITTPDKRSNYIIKLCIVNYKMYLTTTFTSIKGVNMG